ncbi:hypothetical protein [Helicobacter trogontum]|uniref:hypothetical protein n=1 Tax=Helicobacter trogontum TaxID=50960 RepID=UPI000CF10CAA|nr:hypothetical protein [Helicobacter trogontum]
MKTFEEWLNLFNSQNFYEFNRDESGILWLKIKSMIRREILEFITEQFNITLQTKTQQEKFKELYGLALNNMITHKDIDMILCAYNKVEIQNVEQIFHNIESELYKMTYFSWGGDSTNSLDKQIVSYVKNIYRYDEILSKIENEIADNTRNYTLSSWYNNWTTILTEHIFKTHNKVISAIGKIKSVDFFIDNIPIDLKITYLPKEFLKSQRKYYGFGNEITLLKKIAKQENLTFDKTSSEETIKYRISQQIKDKNNEILLAELKHIDVQNKQIIDDAICNKQILAQWLYENQGELRFGAENRLFIILIDSLDFSASWKLKRNFHIIKPKITSYLDNFNKMDFAKNIVDFTFHQKRYRALADIIFILK